MRRHKPKTRCPASLLRDFCHTLPVRGLPPAFRRTCRGSPEYKRVKTRLLRRIATHMLRKTVAFDPELSWSAKAMPHQNVSAAMVEWDTIRGLRRTASEPRVTA